ncbi:hypothetical protein CCY16_00456 [Wolbachia endosymbiont of Wuchereria bancrofti]|nr:hypothetical protein CCY16_00456 [Wolbachia endosymbiont of Wuchereria bancrofti]
MESRRGRRRPENSARELRLRQNRRNTGRMMMEEVTEGLGQFELKSGIERRGREPETFEDGTRELLIGLTIGLEVSLRQSRENIERELEKMYLDSKL